MMYHSLTNNSIRRSFAEALREGLAPDRGLYVPESVPALNWSEMKGMSLPEMGAKFLEPLVGNDLKFSDLERLIDDALDFDIPLTEKEGNLQYLELFHGPTAAFKDVGARIMSRLLGATSNERLTVLVATSGDTGSAVAQGFYQVPNIDVVILYPSGRISHIQEQQLTTVGGNVAAIEVQGSFDDCQAMVKEAFLDQAVQKARPLTSANSINIGRWMPQGIYYAWATAQAQEPLNFIVPSGNFGNIAAGMLANRMGMPALSFCAAVNANEGMKEFMEVGHFEPRPSIQTISNAMDVGDPSNRPRLEWLCGHDIAQLQKSFRVVSVDDELTKESMRNTWEEHQRQVCPHTAVGVRAAQLLKVNGPRAVLSTADPAKFGDVVTSAIGKEPTIPERLQGCLLKKKVSIEMSAEYAEFRHYLLDGSS